MEFIPRVTILKGPCNDSIEPAILAPYEYDPFQKHAFKAIQEKQDVFVCAHTSSGKTAVAEDGIIRTLRNGKSVIYASPIKSLSNEKCKEFSEKFEQFGYKVGILTGDNKTNVEEKCLIMTAEILRNALYNLRQNAQHQKKSVSQNFIDNLGCVILDEIHFMNDPDRGRVWEEIIILLPPTVQLIMLSATVSNPEKFAYWVSMCRKSHVVLIFTEKRIVPLIHSLFVDGKLYQFLDENMTFSGEKFNIGKQEHQAIVKEREKKHKSRIDENAIPNMVKFLKEKDLLQAIFFSFSRQNCEKYAHSINISLIDHIERSEVDKLFWEHMHPHLHLLKDIPQVIDIKECLRVGIAYHHSGLLPVLKEIVEIAFKKGFVKVLFATETFAVGVNTPTRTVVFTELEKFTNKKKRFITTSEYRQMSGRAGRRGKDVVGNVILLPIYNFPDEQELRAVVLGSVPEITSKFKWDYQFFLKITYSTNIDINSFFTRSLFNSENMMVLYGLYNEEIRLTEKIVELGKRISECQENLEPVELFLKTEKSQSQFGLAIKVTLTKQQQKTQQVIKKQIDSSANLRAIIPVVRERNMLVDKLSSLKEQIKTNSERIMYHMTNMQKILEIAGYVGETSEMSNRGIVGSQINECNPIILTEIIMNDILVGLSPGEIVAIVSLFTDPVKLEIDDDQKVVYIENKIISDKYNQLKDIISRFREIEVDISGAVPDYGDWDLSVSYIDMALMWANKATIPEMLEILVLKGEYEGNFVKNMLKISNIVHDIIGICKMTEKINLLPVLEQIDSLILRDFVSVSSLYLT